MTELVETWAQLPLQSVAYHGRHAHLSKWFFARAEFQLAKRFRASSYPNDFIDADGNERPDWLRNWILSEARAHRNKLASGVENASARGITDFDSSMVRYGKGALGGKGRGFRFLHSVSDKFGLQTIIPELRISVPNCFVLATEVFDRFLDENQMRQAALEATADEDLVKLFDAAPLPADVSAELQKYVAQVGARRSHISSRLPVSHTPAHTHTCISSHTPSRRWARRSRSARRRCSRTPSSSRSPACTRRSCCRTTAARSSGSRSSRAR